MRIEDQELDIADIRTFVNSVLTMEHHEPLGAAVALAQASVSLIAASSTGERMALADVLMRIAADLLGDVRQRVN